MKVKIAENKTKEFSGFGADIVNMRTPRQLRVQHNMQVFEGVNSFKGRAIEIKYRKIGGIRGYSGNNHVFGLGGVNG